ncbi:hypothetical protein EVAR_96389_1 [Eumeta japonica]|uniref:Uncharacterized protein n=1 Tax=Eumeta variegata TaxID=151549 RepID=A0A4C1WBB3_EUMVA|nr:hypothetical protein EVAR_96389_1 [Eumeta japonica]
MQTSRADVLRAVSAYIQELSARPAVADIGRQNRLLEEQTHSGIEQILTYSKKRRILLPRQFAKINLLDHLEEEGKQVSAGGMRSPAPCRACALSLHIFLRPMVSVQRTMRRHNKEDAAECGRRTAPVARSGGFEHIRPR